MARFRFSALPRGKFTLAQKPELLALTLARLGLAWWFLALPSCLGQITGTTTGIIPFGSYADTPAGTINAVNLNVHTTIPIRTKGGFSASLQNDNNIYYINPIQADGIRRFRSIFRCHLFSFVTISQVGSFSTIWVRYAKVRGTQPALSGLPITLVLYTLGP